MILVFNTYHTTLKFGLFEKPATGVLKSVVHGQVSNIGGQSLFEWSNGSVAANISVELSDLEDAADWVLHWLEHLWPLGSLLEGLKIVAHRCANCSISSSSPTLIQGTLHPAIQSGAHCAVGISRERFPDDVVVVVVPAIESDQNELAGNDEEAWIARSALKAVDASMI